jgi:hypothetical protein
METSTSPAPMISSSSRLLEQPGFRYGSDEFFRLLRIDGTTGQVEKDTGFWYADDLFLTSDDRLLVGSRTLAPEFFDLDLNPLGSAGAEQQMFVTQMDSTAAVPEPSEALLVASGLFMLIGLARRRTAGKSRR